MVPCARFEMCLKWSSRVNNKEKRGAKFNAYLLPDAYNPAVNLRCIFPYIILKSPRTSS